jgi:diguanylate cyclase (GGDEF)-like protein
MNFLNKHTIITSIIISIILTTIILLSFINISKQESIELSQKVLKQEAIAHFDNMVNTRTWNANLDGVFVKATKNLKKNPYLHDNHAYTKDGDLLIKINPATMTRQISKISNNKSHYLFKITSMDPINPENKPDSFEEQGLLFLKDNRNEKYFTNIENNKYNLIGSLTTEPSCLKCHQEQDYKIGDVRGGLRVSIPLDNYNITLETIKSNSFTLTSITIFFAIIIGICSTFFINLIYKRQESIEKLNDSLEIKIKERTKELEANVLKLNELATIDYLTNIPNRRYFFDLGEKNFFLAKRESKELTLLLLDIDLFKNINDTYGHDIGDEILKLVAITIKENLRNSDILARFGGEEFVVLLNETDIKGAENISIKLKDLIEVLNYQIRDEIIKITVSIGVTSIKQEDINLNNLIKRADKGMYKAKTKGRNTITLMI